MAEKGRGKRIRFQGGTVFPVIMVVVVALGLGLIGYARATAGDQAQGARANANWHIAFGIYNCSAYIDPIQALATAPTNGVTTQGDGIIYYNPTDASVSGGKANLSVYLDNYGVSLGSTTLTVPASALASTATTTPVTPDTTPATTAGTTAGTGVTATTVASGVTTTPTSQGGPARESHVPAQSTETTTATTTAAATTTTAAASTTAAAGTASTTPATTPGTAATTGSTTPATPAVGGVAIDAAKDKCNNKPAELRTYVWKDATKPGDFSVVNSGNRSDVRITNDNMAIAVFFVDPTSDAAKSPPQPPSVVKLAALNGTASTTSTVAGTAGSVVATTPGTAASSATTPGSSATTAAASATTVSPSATTAASSATTAAASATTAG